MLAAAAALAIGITIPAMAVVSGSPSGFESSDGNMTVEGTTHAADWNCFANGKAAGFASGINVGTGTCSTALVLDNAVALHPDANNGTNGEVTWKSGQKLDTDCPVLTNNSSVPNKDDFTGIASYNESDSATPPNTFLYGGEIRATANGNSSGNVELNQSAGTTACPITRTAGDRLLAFDFTGGGTVLDFHALTWITPGNPTAGGNNGTCDISNHTPPCWGAKVITSGGGITVGGCGTTNNDVEGCSNQSAIAAGDNGIDKTALVAQQFAEFGVNLTKVLGLTGCFPVTQEVWESRSSGSSFTSNPEDIEIEHHPISNCGEVKIIKHTDPRGINQNFSYSSNLSGSQLSCTQSGPTSFTLNDNGNSSGDSAANTQDCTSVPIGKYTVTEGADPNGFTFEGLSCTATGSGSGSQDGTTPKQADITIAAGGDTVTCTYTNQQNTATMTTQVSTGSPFFPGQPVHDTATIVGNQPTETPSGTVNFFLCGPIPGGSGSCTSGGIAAGSGTLSGSGGTASATSAPDVNSASPLTPGFYCFRAEWGGDNHYPGTLIGGADGTNECFTVRTITTSTTTTPSAGHGGTTTFGSTVTDHAIVQAAQSGDGFPSGTVTFFICSPNQLTSGACQTGGTQVGSPVTTVDAGGTPPASSADSTGFTVNQTGTWCWRAEYNPGPPNGANYTGSSDATTGECFTVNDTTASTSLQDWLPNDTAIVSSVNGAPLTGTLSAQLFMSSDCTGSAVGGQSYSKTLTGTSSSATLTTNNTTFKVSSPGPTTVSWLVTFTSTDSNVAGSVHCESTSLTITN